MEDPASRGQIIETLKKELEILEKGGYAPSSEEPHWMPRVFRDSVSCPNLGLEFKVEPCSHCYLMQFVPPQYHQKENPCHYLPLNEKGDTVASLTQTGNYEPLYNALHSWLKSTLAQLESETPAMLAESEPGQ